MKRNLINVELQRLSGVVGAIFRQAKDFSAIKSRSIELM